MSAPIHTQLHEYTDFFDGRLVEVTVEEILTERVSRGPVRPLRPRLASARRGRLVAAGVAVAAAILGVVALLLSAQTEPAPPAQTTVDTNPAPEPETLPGPSVPPRLIESGSLDTVLGNLDWSSYLDAAGAEFGLAEAPGGGLVAWSVVAGTYWLSDDGSEWETSRFPVADDAKILTVLRGEQSFWVAAGGPASLWRSDDLDSWHQVELEPIPFPSSFNVEWELTGAQVAEAGGGALVAWEAAPIIPLGSLETAHAGTHSDLFIDAFGDVDGIYPVRGTRLDDGVEEVVASVYLQHLGSNIESWQLMDAATGLEVAYFAFDAGGVEVDPLSYRARGMLYVDASRGVEPAVPAWMQSGDRTRGIAGIGGGVYVLSGGGGAAEIALWTSVDGETWESLGPPSFLSPETEAVFLSARDGLLHAHVVTEQSDERWVSADGVAWQLLPGPPPRDPTVTVGPFSGGFAGWSDGTLWASADGVAWESHELADIGLAADAERFSGGYTGAIIGQRLFVRMWSDDPSGSGRTIVFETAR